MQISLKAITTGTSSQQHNDIHSKILSTLLEVFVRHTFDSCRKAFMKFIIKWMYSQISCNFVFLINTLQDTTTELGSRQFIVDVELPF